MKSIFGLLGVNIFKRGDWIRSKTNPRKTGQVYSAHPDGRVLVQWDGYPAGEHRIVQSEEVELG